MVPGIRTLAASAVRQWSLPANRLQLPVDCVGLYRYSLRDPVVMRPCRRDPFGDHEKCWTTCWWLSALQ